jgi:hypothetical protein
VEICNRRQALLKHIAQINNEVREGIKVTQLAGEAAKWLGKGTSKVSDLILANEEIPGAPILAAAYKWESHAFEAEELYSNYLERRSTDQVKHWDSYIVAEVKQYNADCKGYTVAARTRTTPVPGARAGAAGIRSVTRNVRRIAKANRKNAKSLNAALLKLTAHLTGTTAPAGDVAAVRKQASLAVKLIQIDIKARKKLGRNRALKKRRLHARDLPPSLRRNRHIRQLIGKPLTEVVAGKDVLDAERRLIAVLRLQPILP